MGTRYFIGITLPEELSSAINDAQGELFAGHKVMPPLQSHITLLHPSMLETSSPIYFVPKVREAASGLLPIQIHLSKIATFDERVLYIDVESYELINAYEKLVEILPEKIIAQYTVGRQFKPHITLAQAKPKQKLDPDLLAKLRQRISPLLPYDFTAEHLSQFTWLRPRTYRVRKINH